MTRIAATRSRFSILIKYRVGALVYDSGKVSPVVKLMSSGVRARFAVVHALGVVTLLIVCSHFALQWYETRLFMSWYNGDDIQVYFIGSGGNIPEAAERIQREKLADADYFLRESIRFRNPKWQEFVYKDCKAKIEALISGDQIANERAVGVSLQRNLLGLALLNDRQGLLAISSWTRQLDHPVLDRFWATHEAMFGFNLEYGMPYKERQVRKSVRIAVNGRFYGNSVKDTYLAIVSGIHKSNFYCSDSKRRLFEAIYMELQTCFNGRCSTIQLDQVHASYVEYFDYNTKSVQEGTINKTDLDE